MADRQLQAILSSGEITSMNIGGTDSGDAVAKVSDISPNIISVGTMTQLSAQTLVAGVPEILFYFSEEVIKIGSSLSSSTTTQEIFVATSGVYKIMGTVKLTDGNANEVHTITLYNNGIATPFKGSITGNGNIVFIGATPLSQGDDLQLYITSTSTSITVVNSSIIVEKI